MGYWEQTGMDNMRLRADPKRMRHSQLIQIAVVLAGAMLIGALVFWHH